MAVSITFGRKADASRNHVGGNFTTIGTTTGVLKDDTSVITPTFIVHVNHQGMPAATQIVDCNYCYCKEFNRYYWITDIVQHTTAVWNITCEVDVLQTYWNDISQTDAYATRAQNGSIWLADPMTPKAGSSHASEVDYALENFDPEGSFIITFASEIPNGKLGVTSCYSCTASEMKAIAETLYSQDFYDKFKNSMANPDAALIRAVWLPYDVSSCCGGTQNIKFNNITVGTGAPVNTLSGGGDFVVNPYIPHKVVAPDYDTYATYMNLPPYANYSIFLPGVGLTDLPMEQAFGTGADQPAISVQYKISIPTGEIFYKLVRLIDVVNSGAGVIIKTASGKLGTDIPISHMQNSTQTAVTSAVGALVYGGETALMAMTGNTIGAIAFGGSTLVQLNNANMGQYTSTISASGSLGTFYNSDLDMLQCRVQTVWYDVSDYPSNIRTVVGLPMCKKVTIGSQHGYLKCDSAFVKTKATLKEQQMIANFLNNEGIYILY